MSMVYKSKGLKSPQKSLNWAVGRSENHKNAIVICHECYYYVLVYYKTGFEEKN